MERDALVGLSDCGAVSDQPIALSNCGGYAHDLEAISLSSRDLAAKSAESFKEKRLNKMRV